MLSITALKGHSFFVLMQMKIKTKKKEKLFYPLSCIPLYLYSTLYLPTAVSGHSAFHNTRSLSVIKYLYIAYN